MTVFSGRTLRKAGIFEPFSERRLDRASGMTAGLSLCGYDICIDGDTTVYPGFTVLAGSRERFAIPKQAMIVICDKSTLVREGIFVKNTVAEPGWSGWLTLELSYAPLIHPNDGFFRVLGKRLLLATGFYPPYILKAGTPIAQVIAHEIDLPTEGYCGKYQDQKRGPQPAR